MMSRRVAAEALGTGLLVATVVGSGIMAQRLAGGNEAIALLANTLATGAILLVLITLFMPISAQFNPVVTVLLGRQEGWPWLILAQILGGIAGTIMAHLMFGRAVISVSTHLRTGPDLWLSEAVATFGLLFTITLGGHHRPAALPALVAGWIVAAYWFTASTSFANPAVTIARALTDSFSGIRPVDAPYFIVAQLTGAMAGTACARWFIKGEQ